MKISNELSRYLKGELFSNGLAVDFGDELGFINVYKFDLFSDTLPKIIREEKYDYVVMGEILEHVDNPVIFLKK